MTRPVPPHGTYARGNGSPGYREPCHCEPCTAAKRKTRKLHKVNRELGRSSIVDAAAAREHLAKVHEHMGWISLAAAAKCDEKTLWKIHSGERKRITRSVHDRILAVGIPQRSDSGLYLDATGSMRRCQALMAIGHSGQVIATAASTTSNRIRLIANGHQAYVRRHLADRIKSAYKELAYQPPTPDRFTSRVRNTARVKGWHGPFAWDGNIDDPNAEPDTTLSRPIRGGLTGAAYKQAEAEHLYQLGESVDQIARILGCSSEYVDHLLGWPQQRAA